LPGCGWARLLHRKSCCRIHSGRIAKAPRQVRLAQESRLIFIYGTWGFKMGSPPPPHPTPSSGPRGRLQGSGGGLCTQSQTWGVQRGKVENAQFVQREPAIGTAQVPGGGGENQETGRHSRGDSLLQADERRRAPERLRATTAPHPHTPHSLFRPRFGRTV
jgi:hypothetical protein